MDAITQMAWRVYRDARQRVWPGADVVLEDKAKAEIVTITDGWNAVKITSEAEGTPELALLILPQDTVTEAVLRDSVRFVVLKGRRHEKRTYEYRTDAPERHQIRFQPIGEAA